MRVERIYRSDWASATTSSIQIPNSDLNNPLACIALGPNDQSGGVIVTPQTANDLNGQTVRVGPKAPLYFPVTGPLNITNIYTNSAFGTQQIILDLFLYYGCPPNFVPERPPLRYSGSLNSQVGDQVYVPVFGRKNMSVIWKVNTTNTTAVTIYAANMLSSGSPLLRALHSDTGTAGTVYSFSPSNARQPDTPVGEESNPVMFDFLAIGVGTAVAASTVDYIVEASD